jgi:hypothetical protein
MKYDLLVIGGVVLDPAGGLRGWPAMKFRRKAGLGPGSAKVCLPAPVYWCLTSPDPALIAPGRKDVFCLATEPGFSDGSHRRKPRSWAHRTKSSVSQSVLPV